MEAAIRVVNAVTTRLDSAVSSGAELWLLPAVSRSTAPRVSSMILLEYDAANQVALLWYRLGGRALC